MPRPPPPAAALIITGKPIARFLRELGVALVGALVARHARHAGLDHAPLGGGLVAHGGDAAGGGPMNMRPASSQAARSRVFGQKAVARMDRVGAALGAASRMRSMLDSSRRRRRADARGLVGDGARAARPVGVGVDGDRADAHRLAVRMTRHAISPRLATRMVWKSLTRRSTHMFPPPLWGGVRGWGSRRTLRAPWL